MTISDAKENDDRLLTRRRFLTSALPPLAVAAYLALGGVTQTPGQVSGRKLGNVTDGITLTDQHGKAFNMAELLGKGPCLVVFGYGGCPMCQRITDSVAAIQSEMIGQKRKLPIVVISVQPEQDRGDDAMKTYTASYYEKGVRQFADETLPDGAARRREAGERAFTAAKGKKQEDRILHIVCPPTAKDAQTLEQRIGLLINVKDAKQHSAFITLFNNGQVVKGFRALDREQNAPAAFTRALAKTVAAEAGRAAGPER